MIKNVIQIYIFFEDILPPYLACRLRTILLLLLKRQVRFSYDAGYFSAEDGFSKRFFKYMRRGFSLYSRGLEERGRELLYSYCLQDLDINGDDVVIDCGANYGDLVLSFKNNINLKKYYAYEPSPDNFKLLSFNIKGSNLINKGLSNTNGKLCFYLSDRDADSSFISSGKDDVEILVDVTTLDSELLRCNWERVKLFKLEAEGYEPEILEGGVNFLSICEYVAFDGGPERGEMQDTTFETVSNILYKSGFKMIKINLESGRALFKNIKLNDKN